MYAACQHWYFEASISQLNVKKKHIQLLTCLRKVNFALRRFVGYALLQYQICTQGCGICRKQQLKTCRKWKVRECQWLRCKVLFEAKNVCVLLRVCILCSAEVMRRVSFDDTRARCSVRTWGVLCGCVWLDHPPQSPSPGYYNYCTTATSLKQTQRRGAASAAVDKAHGAVIDIAAAPCQSSRMWPHAFVGLLGDLASTRPSRIDRALAVRW